MFTRRGNDWTRFRPIVAILADLPVNATCLDGENAVLTLKHGGAPTVNLRAGRIIRVLPQLYS